MKKTLFILLLMIAVFCMTATVAQGNIELVAKIPGAHLIDHTNLLAVNVGDGVAIATIDGTPLTEPIYSSFEYDTGWLRADLNGVEVDHAEGLLSMDCETIIPHQYYAIDVLNEYWALAFTVKPSTEIEYDFSNYTNYDNWTDNKYEYWVADTVDVYALPEGKLLASIPREHIRHKDCYAIRDYINVTDRATGIIVTYDHSFNVLGQIGNYTSSELVPKEDNGFVRFQENNQWGLMDTDGNVILPPEYDSIDSTIIGDCFTFTVDGKMGLADLKGNILVPADFDEVIHPNYIRDKNEYVIEGYVGVVKDGKLGYYKVGSDISCEPSYALSNLEFYGITARFIDMDGNRRVLAADGVVTVYPDLTVAEMDFSNGRYYIVGNDKGDGLIDWHGKELLPPENNNVIKPSGDGQYVVVKENYKADVPTYIYKLTWTDDDPPVEGDRVEADASANIPYATEGEPLTVTLEPVAEVKNARWIQDSDLLMLEMDGGRALASIDGTQLSEPIFSYISSDYGWVDAIQGSLGDENYAECLMNSSGETIIPPGHQIIIVENEKWAVAKTLVPCGPDDYDYDTFNGGKLYYRYDRIDLYHLPSAHLVTSLAGDEVKTSTYDFERDYLSVYDKKTDMTTVYDCDSNVLGQKEGTLSWPWEFIPREKETIYGSQNAYVLKDTEGNVITSDQFRVKGEVLNGLFTVSDKAGKTGLADVDGNLLIPMEYDSIEPIAIGNKRFYAVDGYACIVWKERLGYYTLGVGISCEPYYAKRSLSIYGVAAGYTDMGNKKHILTADGVEWVPEGYGNVAKLNNNGGYFYVVRDKQDQNRGLIDWHGYEVLPMDYESINMSGSGKYLLLADHSDTLKVLKVLLEDAESSETEISAEGSVEAMPENGSDDVETWTCENGHEGNTLQFCPICGVAKPESTNEQACPN